MVLNSFVSSAKIFAVLHTIYGRSFVKITKRTGPITLPWGILLSTSAHVDGLPLTMTHCFRPNRKSLIQSFSVPLIPYASSFRSRRLCGILSNAFLKSRYMTSTGSPLSSHFVHSSIVNEPVSNQRFHHFPYYCCKAHWSVIPR